MLMKKLSVKSLVKLSTMNGIMISLRIYIELIRKWRNRLANRIMPSLIYNRDMTCIVMQKVLSFYIDHLQIHSHIEDQRT